METRLKSVQIRQGDVYLQPIETLGKEFVESPRDPDGSAVLARGEATGHKHRLERACPDEGCALSRILVHPVARGEVARVVLETPDVLLHEEHSPHKIPAGTWRVSRPYEYIAPDLIRQVAD